MNFFEVRPENLNDWTNAISFLITQMEYYPTYTDEIISRCIFHEWRFIVTNDNEIVFANGILPAITEADFTFFKTLNP